MLEAKTQRLPVLLAYGPIFRGPVSSGCAAVVLLTTSLIRKTVRGEFADSLSLVRAAHKAKVKTMSILSSLRLLKRSRTMKGYIGNVKQEHVNVTLSKAVKAHLNPSLKEAWTQLSRKQAQASLTSWAVVVAGSEAVLHERFLVDMSAATAISRDIQSHTELGGIGHDAILQARRRRDRVEDDFLQRGKRLQSVEKVVQRYVRGELFSAHMELVETNKAAMLRHCFEVRRSNRCGAEHFETVDSGIAARMQSRRKLFCVERRPYRLLSLFGPLGIWLDDDDELPAHGTASYAGQTSEAHTVHLLRYDGTKTTVDDFKHVQVGARQEGEDVDERIIADDRTEPLKYVVLTQRNDALRCSLRALWKAVFFRTHYDAGIVVLTLFSMPSLPSIFVWICESIATKRPRIAGTCDGIFMSPFATASTEMLSSFRNSIIDGVTPSVSDGVKSARLARLASTDWDARWFFTLDLLVRIVTANTSAQQLRNQRQY